VTREAPTPASIKSVAVHFPHDVPGLFLEHYDQLFRYLLWLTGDADLADDAAQEAFVKLVEKPPAPYATRAWLYTVGENAALSALRTRARQLRLLAEWPDRVPVGDSPLSPLALVEALDVRDWVRGALDRLPEKQRQILLLRAEGFVEREIAEAVGTTSRSVGTMFARALKKLTAELRLDRHMDR
jgi:RNA polymerase sigma-70 factor (ECF subfamily)